MFNPVHDFEVAHSQVVKSLAEARQWDVDYLDPQAPLNCPTFHLFDVKTGYLRMMGIPVSSLARLPALQRDANATVEGAAAAVHTLLDEIRTMPAPAPAAQLNALGASAALYFSLTKTGQLTGSLTPCDNVLLTFYDNGLVRPAQIRANGPLPATQAFHAFMRVIEHDRQVNTSWFQ